ncbi:caspase family protein [Streptomyces cocklensis]|uniref:60 kDa chaperonin n=1 Tax=Actinacidiphila cocklensis TaxID=887465 RepID=A0A9W4GV84_9ACTN|nr:TCP-1/cpn60 chaperonin family protein [Actinacidiphila cocklensis]MDD1058854.1 caspase family protein [Actinacidiphila cocklensis]CAG6398984.1 60 kDa chaperonin [Actinacidiphila cocklensis]
MAGREALIVTTSVYEDPRWNRLYAPGHDGNALGGVLADPDIGGYTVHYVVDEPAHVVRRRIDRFLARRRTADELLLYFSCHGVKDDDGRLYLAAADTEFDRDLLESAAVSAAFLNERLKNCRARSKVLVLDCCYSGAFDPGAKGPPSADIAEHLGKGGTAVITSTNELQLAWEENGLTDRGSTTGTMSVFTSAAVEGLRTGEADRDKDGLVSVDDLFGHVSETMKARDARQTPRLWVLGSEAAIVVARSAAAGARAGAVPGGYAVLPPASVGDRRAYEIHAGVAAAAEAVRATVGPLPRFAVVRQADGTLLRTADASAAVHALTPATAWAGLGLDLVRALVTRMRTQSGDGAAGAVLVLEALLGSLQPALRAGTHPALLARGVEAVVGAAGSALLPLARGVRTALDVQQIAVTATRDPQVGRIVSQALDKVGREGVVRVEEGHSPGLGLRIEEGLRLDGRRLVPPPRAAEPAGGIVLERPYVALCDFSLSSGAALKSLVDVVDTAGRPLVVLAHTVADDALPAGPRPGGGRGAVVVAAGTETLRDVAAWSGAGVVSDEESLRYADLELLGTARRAVVTSSSVVLSDGTGDIAALAQRFDVIRALIERAPSQEERARQRERLARLFGGVAVIEVGGADGSAALVRSAVRVCQAAVGGGMLPGAAACLAQVGRDFEVGFRDAPAHVRVLSAALATALAAPLEAVAANSGEADAAAVAGRLAEVWPRATYDAVSCTFQEMGTAGVWDPFPVQLDLLRAVGDAVREYLAMV